jgi:hypothetical protein
MAEGSGERNAEALDMNTTEKCLLQVIDLLEADTKSDGTKLEPFDCRPTGSSAFGGHANLSAKLLRSFLSAVAIAVVLFWAPAKLPGLLTQSGASPDTREQLFLIGLVAAAVAQAAWWIEVFWWTYRAYGGRWAPKRLLTELKVATLFCVLDVLNWGVVTGLVAAAYGLLDNSIIVGFCSFALPIVVRQLMFYVLLPIQALRGSIEL